MPGRCPVSNYRQPPGMAHLRSFGKVMNHPRPSDKELQAMIVNERLGKCGLFPEFEDETKTSGFDF